MLFKKNCCDLPGVPGTQSQGGLEPQLQALQYISNDSFVCYQDLFEYICFSIVEWGFHGESALKIHS